MSRKFLFVLLFLLMLLPAGISYAQSGEGDGQPIGPRHSDTTWQAEIWNNASFTGPAALVTAHTDINFDWGYGGPSGVGADLFSIRWTRYLYLEEGTYVFRATADDGIRVSVDGQQIINEWYDHPARTFTAERALGAGHHLVVVEYYEDTGLAVARLQVEKKAPTINNWRGEYFSGTGLGGTPVLVRDDASINFDWGLGSPGPGVPADNFSVRWTRTLPFSAGNYRFTTTVDDGVRLWVNGHLLIDKWFNQAATTYTGEIYLSGNVPVKMEFFDSRDHAVARLSWQAASGGQPDNGGSAPPPSSGAVIVDDGDAGFVMGGAATSWRRESMGYNGDLTWTRNNDVVRSNYNWARWYPSLRAGRYEVFVYIPSRYATTGAARYWISHRDGYTLRVVSQAAYSDSWISLGTYWFRGTGEDYVSLADVTYEPYVSRLIAFDGMMWQPR